MAVTGICEVKGAKDFIPSKTTGPQGLIYRQVLRTAYAGKESEGKNMLGCASFQAADSGLSYTLNVYYADSSSEENPVLKVCISKDGRQTKEYRIAAREIRPENASELEIFTLCMYADKKGFGVKGAAGSYQTVKKFRQSQGYNKRAGSALTLDDFCNQKQNWVREISLIQAEFLNGGIYKQAMDGNAILEMFTEFDKISGGTKDAHPDNTMTEKEWREFLDYIDRQIEAIREENRREHKLREKMRLEEKAEKKERERKRLLKLRLCRFRIVTWQRSYIRCKGENGKLLWEYKIRNGSWYDKVCRYLMVIDQDDGELMDILSKREFWNRLFECETIERKQGAEALAASLR